MKFYEFMIKERFISYNEKKCRNSIFEWRIADISDMIYYTIIRYELSYLGIINGFLRFVKLVAVFENEKLKLKNRRLFLK